MAEVPDDLIIQIMVLLPVKSLLRFRCVSKSLCDLLDSADFINLHLNTTSSICKIIFQEYLISPYFHINPAPIHVFNIDIDPFPPARNIPSNHSGGNDRFSNKVFAHCNGLVLLEECSSSLVVWNPFTRKSRKLPNIFSHSDRITGCGFGYDPSTDDYKVMVMKAQKPYHEILILGLRSGYWRRVQLHGDLFRNSLIQNFSNCFVDGAFHFLCNSVIYALDLAKETLSHLSLPDFDITRGYSDNYLHVLEGCLCVSSYSRQEKQFEFYARKKNKNDVGELSWTRLFSIVVSSQEIFRNGIILGFSKGRDKIYILYDQYALYLYDFTEKKLKWTGAGDKHNQKVLFCTESLVWIKKKNRKKKKKGNLKQL